MSLCVYIHASHIPVCSAYTWLEKLIFRIMYFKKGNSFINCLQDYKFWNILPNYIYKSYYLSIQLLDIKPVSPGPRTAGPLGIWNCNQGFTDFILKRRSHY